MKQERSHRVLPLATEAFYENSGGKKTRMALKHENPNVYSFVFVEKHPSRKDQLYGLGGVLTYGYLRNQAQLSNTVPEKVKKRTIREYIKEMKRTISTYQDSNEGFQAETRKQLEKFKAEEPTLWQVLEQITNVFGKKHDTAVFQGAADVYSIFKKHMETQNVRIMFHTEVR